MKDTLTVESPAKVNLRLEVLKKRADGYHEIKTILQKISLHDTLCFSLRKEPRISITTDHPTLPTGEGNLVHKACQSILKRSDYRGGIEIDIQKRIPLGAGLGGGSSNAAATLSALNRLLRLNLSRKDLKTMAVEIGADVPFFLIEGSAIGTGVGERLKPITLPPLWYVLIYPNLEVSAGWAYENCVLTKRRFHYNIHEFLSVPQDTLHLLQNDLEEGVSRAFPQIERMKDYLRSTGAEGVLMTGSGSTVFGLYFNEGGATEAYKKTRRLVRRNGWIVLSAHGI